MSTTNRSLLTEQYYLPFSAQEIYDAFASAPVFASWWGLVGSTTVQKFDFKPGGDLHFTVHQHDGAPSRLTGVFEQLVPAERIVIRFASEPAHTLSVQLTSPVGGGTNLSWERALDIANTSYRIEERLGSTTQNLRQLTRALRRRRRMVWYSVFGATVLPHLLTIVLGQTALAFPGTIKQVWFDSFQTALLLLAPLVVVYVLARAKVNPLMRVLGMAAATVFFLLIAVSAVVPSSCDRPEYIGPGSREATQNCR